MNSFTRCGGAKPVQVCGCVLRAVLLTVPLLCISLLCGCEPPAWRPVAPAGAGVQAQMPGSPTETASLGDLRYTSKTGDNEIILAVVTLPPERQGRDMVRQVLQDSRDGGVANVEGAYLSGEREIMLAEHPGLAFEIAAPNDQWALCRTYVIDGRLVALVVAGRKAAALEADARRFFDSLALTNPAPAPTASHSEAIASATEVAPWQDTAHDAPPETAHAASPEIAHAASPETAHDAPWETAHDAPPETAHDAPPETAHDAPPETAHDAPPETAHSEPRVMPRATPRNTPFTTVRTHWRYENAPHVFGDQASVTGDFLKQEQGWVEQTTSGTTPFEEVGRTDDYIELQKPNNGFRVRLFANRSDYRFGNSPTWRPMYPGRWMQR